MVVSSFKNYYADLEEILNPFLPKKPEILRIGLGLFLSYDIVKVHSGELLVETKEGEGSASSIQLLKTN